VKNRLKLSKAFYISPKSQQITMVQRIGGFRRKTRHKLKKDIRSKGKTSLSRFLQDLNIGDRVCLKADSSYQKGMYFPRFHGKIGVVKAKKGRYYEVLVKDQNKEKTLLLHPLHFKMVQ
jgi:large subunit ribosomal protein L21e